MRLVHAVGERFKRWHARRLQLPPAGSDRFAGHWVELKDDSLGDARSLSRCSRNRSRLLKAVVWTPMRLLRSLLVVFCLALVAGGCLGSSSTVKTGSKSSTDGQTAPGTVQGLVFVPARGCGKNVCVFDIRGALKFCRDAVAQDRCVWIDRDASRSRCLPAATRYYRFLITRRDLEHSGRPEA